MFSPASSPKGPRAETAARGAAGGESPTRSKASVLSLDPVDTKQERDIKDEGGGICSDPLSSNQSVCGIWLPWFSGSSSDPPPSSAEEAESIIESILTATVLPNYAERVLPQLEVLLDKHGIESVVYLPAKSGGQQPVGKKCMIRSYMDQARVEFRVRSAGELKKMKFDWGDIEEMGAGKYADSAPTPATATPSSKKSQANCYMYIKIRDRGTVDLRFESKALRDATIMGFKLLQVKRQGKLA